MNATEEVIRFRNHIAAMCMSCESGGKCRDTLCPLRPVSPLPLADESRLFGPPAYVEETKGSDQTWPPVAGNPLGADHSLGIAHGVFGGDAR